MGRNHIYIPSKGRPQCMTAEYLRDGGYPAEWTIVLGDNDETIPEYVERFGEEHCLVFDHSEWWDRTDMKDPFEKSKPSGVAPARNFIMDYARSVGEDRIWMFDDDYKDVERIDPDGTRTKLYGAELLRHLAAIDEFGRKADLRCTGFWPRSISNSGDSVTKYRVTVYNGFNLSTREDNVWSGRLYEDTHRTVWGIVHGQPDFCFNCYAITVGIPYFAADKSCETREDGGLKETYKSLGEGDARSEANVRQVCYVLMTHPQAIYLTKAEECYSKVIPVKRMAPKLLHEKWAISEPRKRVLFASDRPLDRAENIKAVYDACRHAKRFVQMSKEPDAVARAAEDGYSAVVTDEYIPPIRNKGDLKVMVIGHALTGGKSYGLDQPNPWFGDESSGQIDCLVATSERGRAVMASSAGVDVGRCLALGSPRTDKYLDGSVEPIGFHMESVYLFAPTFRNAEEPPMPKLDWELVDSLLGDGELLVVKRHMKTTRKLVPNAARYEHVMEATNRETSDRYILGCDVVATDYSSIVFDGYIAGKPSVLFCPDKDEYLSARGMYHDYPSFYSPRSCSDEREFVRLLREARESGMTEDERRCRDAVGSACDGHSTERILRKLDELMGVEPDERA